MKLSQSRLTSFFFSSFFSLMSCCDHRHRLNHRSDTLQVRLSVRVKLKQDHVRCCLQSYQVVAVLLFQQEIRLLKTWHLLMLWISSIHAFVPLSFRDSTRTELLFLNQDKSGVSLWSYNRLRKMTTQKTFSSVLLFFWNLCLAWRTKPGKTESTAGRVNRSVHEHPCMHRNMYPRVELTTSKHLKGKKGGDCVTRHHFRYTCFASVCRR